VNFNIFLPDVIFTRRASMTFCFIDTHVQELGGCMPLFWTQTSKHSQNVARLCVLWLGNNLKPTDVFMDMIEPTVCMSRPTFFLSQRHISALSAGVSARRATCFGFFHLLDLIAVCATTPSHPRHHNLSLTTPAYSC
jgi:hypothetical protein